MCHETGKKMRRENKKEEWHGSEQMLVGYDQWMLLLLLIKSLPVTRVLYTRTAAR